MRFGIDLGHECYPYTGPVGVQKSPFLISSRIKINYRKE